MSTPPKNPVDPQESDLLVPFESKNIPKKYREYYKIKRNNFFASIQGFPELWNYYISLDQIWMHEFEDLQKATDVSRTFPLILFFNAHAKMRVSIELALSGCLGEARSILRDSVEFVAHAHCLINDPNLQSVWLSKHEGYDPKKAFQRAFEDKKPDRLFKGLNELHEKWRELSESGSHANPFSVCDRFEAITSADGSTNWTLNYCGIEAQTWAMSLFSFLLICFVMEQTLFNCYYDRLNLDHQLRRMRHEFELYKENLRHILINRYNVQPPSPIHIPKQVIYRS